MTRKTIHFYTSRTTASSECHDRLAYVKIIVTMKNNIKQVLDIAAAQMWGTAVSAFSVHCDETTESCIMQFYFKK